MLVRNKVGIFEVAVVAVVVIVSGIVAYYFDLMGSGSSTLEVDFIELLSILAVVIAGLAFIGWRRVIDQEREIRRRAKAEREASFLAYHDHLTGLPNRRRLSQALADAVAIPPGAERLHALFVLDLNGFKRVNDVFGHQEGDAVLSLVAQRIAGALRGGDLLARTGGDEFAIVARDVQGSEGAAGIAGRVIASLKEPIIVGRETHQIGTGVGIALVPRDGRDPEELFRKADVALYRAKAEGHSASVFFNEDMDKESRERDRLQRELGRAMADGTLVPFYQPIVDLRTGSIRAFEALARWTHPELGEISPERFIPIAEDSGLIGALTKMLLSRACADAMTWPSHVSLSFNLSPLLLHDEQLDRWVADIAAVAGLSLGRLELEITEQAVVRDLEAARHTLGALRQAGIRIALDDFGTGSSSLFHLRSLKFDVIKIDRSFIEEMNSERESAAIVKALVGLGLGLGVEIIAEGVEQRDQSEQLIGQGCVEGQGFLFGRAVPAEEALHLLSTRQLRLVK